MQALNNPFLSDAARTMDPESIRDLFVDDHNNSRLINSRRNVFLIGERGSGKSMTLLFNSYRVQRLLYQPSVVEPFPDAIGIYVPCNTPLMRKLDYKLLSEFQARVISEHLFVLSIAWELCSTLSLMTSVQPLTIDERLWKNFSYVTGMSMPEGVDFLEALQLACERESNQAQRMLNRPQRATFYENTFSFSSLVMPLIALVKRQVNLAHLHFMIMLDDAHDLNDYQIEALNSWIAYRDRTDFSFKVATAKVGMPKRITATGGSILEGHDYITIDMEKPIHNEESAYGQLARKVVERRIRRIGVEFTPDEFFPIHPELAAGLDAAEARVKDSVKRGMPEITGRRLSDFVYKQKRAEYFRSRSPKANLPPYSGFDMLVYISTGVIRNLLEPCAWMYDAEWSRRQHLSEGRNIISMITPGVQAEVIEERSQAAWQRLRELDNLVEGCSTIDAERIFNLFDQLALHFVDRLHKHKSEPGAISFSISQRSTEVMVDLERLLLIAQKGQMLYVREGPAKEAGARELYYVPNRILWPIRGLDPHGQHARASIKAAHLLAAANGQKIPLMDYDSDDSQLQPSLFE